MTKDPETKEFMMIIEFANNGSLSNILSNDFNNLLWKDKIEMLYYLVMDLKILHELGYFHRDFHSGNILKKYDLTYIFGIIMTELSSGKPPFYHKKHDLNLALDICNGLRPEFGNGTPEIYKKLAYRCVDANPDQRPTVDELYDVLDFWYNSIKYKDY